MDKAEPICFQVFCLLYRKFNTVLLDLLVICLNGLEGCEDFIWNHSLGEFKHALESVVAKNRHDARNNQAVDAGSAAVSHPLVEDLVLEKELGDDEVGSSINFLL